MMIRLAIACSVALVLAACNQTTSAGGPSGVGPVNAAVTPEELPPIYEPLIDAHRVSQARYHRDLAYCRHLAAPQESAARAAAQQAQAGAAISAVGSLVGALPVSTFRQARAIGNTSATLQDIGDVHAAQGAANGDAAMSDYILVVNTCLGHRGYVILR